MDFWDKKKYVDAVHAQLQPWQPVKSVLKESGYMSYRNLRPQVYEMGGDVKVKNRLKLQDFSREKANVCIII